MIAVSLSAARFFLTGDFWFEGCGGFSWSAVVSLGGCCVPGGQSTDSFSVGSLSDKVSPYANNQQRERERFIIQCECPLVCCW